MTHNYYSLMAFLSVGVALYAVVAYGFLPLGVLVHPDMRESFQAHYLWVYAHIFGSALALAIGPTQFSARFRGWRPQVHRWLGQTYLLAGVVVGGLAGLFLAAHAFGGVPGKLGFAILATLWLYTGIRAFTAIRARARSTPPSVDDSKLLTHVRRRHAAATAAQCNGAANPI